MKAINKGITTKTYPSLYAALIFIAILLSAFRGWSQEIQICSQEEKKLLLRIVRNTLTLYLNKQVIPLLHDYPLTPELQKPYGVFVTLKEKNTGSLRGCIGYIIGKKPLAEAVIDCTIQAATRDRRFKPMQAGDDRTVFAEVSVLTPPQRISAIDEILVGRHGLIISKGYRSGVLLPQVPIEWGWDRDEFLKALCKKAGLPDRSWEDGADIYFFSAQVFGENH